MKTQTLMRVSGMTLLAVAVSLVVLGIVYALQYHNPMLIFATVSWNR